jgi:hypothetical protein
VKRFENATSGAGLHVRGLLELVATLPVELVLRRPDPHRPSWAQVARQLVLLPLLPFGMVSL